MDIAAWCEQFSTACPELQQEVVDRVVTVWKRSEECAVVSLLWFVEEPCDLVELFPGLRRSEWLVELCVVGLAARRVVEDVFAVDEAFRAIMVWRTEDCVVHALQ